MAEAVLDKHRAPVLVNVTKTLNSLKKLLNYEHGIIGAVPGQGEFEIAFSKTDQANLSLHEALLVKLEKHIKRKNERMMTLETIVPTFSEACQVDLNQLSVWALYRTAITAYLMERVKREILFFEMTNNFLCFKSKN